MPTNELTLVPAEVECESLMVRNHGSKVKTGIANFMKFAISYKGYRSTCRCGQLETGNLFGWLSPTGSRWEECSGFVPAVLIP